MEGPTRLSRRQNVIGRSLVIAVGVWGWTSLLPAATPQQWLEERQQLDEQLSGGDAVG